MPSIQRFLIQEGDNAGKEIELNAFPYTIGRARDCDIVLDYTEISRLHARVDTDHQNAILEDMGSTNGTFVNGRRLDSGQTHRLRAGDEVRFGTVAIWVFDDPVTTATIAPVNLPTPGLVIDMDAARVTIAGMPIYPPLSPNQFSLLSLLIENAGRIVTREEVCDYVWGSDEDVSDQTIDALVSRLRKRLSETDPEHDYIVTRRGFGLMFQNRKSAL